MKSHSSGKYFIHLDLKHFFSSINKSRITRSLKSRLGYKCAREIAIESTVTAPCSGGLTFILPFGFVQSPMLASICLRHSKLGTTLHELSKTKKTTVSVYVDDIVISTQSLEETQSALMLVKAASKRSGFPLNADKEEGPSKKITAFNIELSHQSLFLCNERLNRFLMAYWASENDYQKAGILGYIQSVNPVQTVSF